MLHLMGKTLLFLLKWLVVFPMVTFVGVTDLLSGERKWRSAELRRMSEERPPMTDEVFTKHLGLLEEKADVAVAVRQAFATHSGVPSAAVHPEDKVAVLLRMMSPWASEFDVVFDVERHLRVKIPLDCFCKLRGPRTDETIGEFAAAATAVAAPTKTTLFSGSDE